MQNDGMNTTNCEPSPVTFDVPEYHSQDWQAEYDKYLAQVYADQYAFGPFSEGRAN